MGTYIDGLWYADDQVETGRDGELRPKAGFTHPALLPMPALPSAPPAQAGDEGAKERDPVRLDKQRHPVTRDKGAFGGR